MARDDAGSRGQRRCPRLAAASLSARKRSSDDWGGSFTPSAANGYARWTALEKAGRSA